MPVREVVQANIPSRSTFALQTGFKSGFKLYPTVILVIPILKKQLYGLMITSTVLMIADSEILMFIHGTSVPPVCAKVSKSLSTALLPGKAE